MNPRPVQTGTLTLHFSRTFRHYIKTGVPKYEQTFNQQWSDIPYQHIVSSLKPRDWQFINVAAKRWRVLSCGFNMMHIIPFENTTTSAGGATGPDISYNLMPYLESYIDKGYQLPIWTTYEGGTLPNKQMTQNSGDQTSASLVIQYYDDKNLKLADTSNFDNYWLGANKSMPFMDLMNSSEWGTIQPTQEFSFEWKPSPEDMIWRHGCMPFNHDNITNDTSYQPANPYGRWDGGFQKRTKTNQNDPNILLQNQVQFNCFKPCPTVLVRPCTLHDSQGNLRNLIFNCLIKYHSTIEIDVNDIGFAPLFTRYNAAESENTQKPYHIFERSAGQSAEKKPIYTQWSGANMCGRAATGPIASGYII